MAAPVTHLSALHPVAAALLYRETGDPFAGSEPARKSVRIGVSSSLSWGFLRELVRRYRTIPDAAALSFLDRSAGEVLRAVRRGEADVGFVQEAMDFGRLSAEPLWRERVMVALSAHHPLAQDAEVAAEALRKETFLAAGDPADRDRQIERIETAIGGAPAAVNVYPVERDTLINLVGLGFGVALATGSTMGAFYPNVVYLPVTGAPASAAFHLVFSPDNHKPELGAFLATARALAVRWAHDPMFASAHR
jgi:DNA-binding transcriptional LysR family regulator